jgi:GntR family transcriptional regulator
MTVKASGVPRRFVRRSGALPVYRQVASALERDVLHGRPNAGRDARPDVQRMALPSESDLSAEFGVSRVTVRQALDELHFKGLIYREKGRGSFARANRIEGVTGFGSFTAEVEATGARPSSILAGFSKVADLPEAMLGHLADPPAPGEGFYRLSRIRCLDGKPVAFEESYLPAALYPGLTKAMIGKGSLYAAMREHWGLDPAWADAAIEPGIADAELAAHLKIDLGAPVVIAWRVTSSEQDQVLEFVRSVYRGDGFALTIRRHRIG